MGVPVVEGEMKRCGSKIKTENFFLRFGTISFSQKDSIFGSKFLSNTCGFVQWQNNKALLF